MAKNLSVNQEAQVHFLSWEDPLEKVMATLSSILTWRIPRTEEPGRLQSMESQRVAHNWATNTFTFFLYHILYFRMHSPDKLYVQSVCIMYIWVKKQQLGPDMEFLTDSKLGKMYDNAVYCHLACLT